MQTNERKGCAYNCAVALRGSLHRLRLRQDPEDLEELLNPQNWQDFYDSVLDEQGTLVGLFSFRNEEDTVEIGLGLRPDRTARALVSIS